MKFILILFSQNAMNGAADVRDENQMETAFTQQMGDAASVTG